MWRNTSSLTFKGNVSLNVTLHAKRAMSNLQWYQFKPLTVHLVKRALCLNILKIMQCTLRTLRTQHRLLYASYIVNSTQIIVRFVHCKLNTDYCTLLALWTQHRLLYALYIVNSTQIIVHFVHCELNTDYYTLHTL